MDKDIHTFAYYSNQLTDHQVDALRYAMDGIRLPNIHVLYSGKHWHIYWNLFREGHKSYSAKLKKYEWPRLEYHFWINFGKGCFSVTFCPHGLDTPK